MKPSTRLRLARRSKRNRGPDSKAIVNEFAILLGDPSEKSWYAKENYFRRKILRYIASILCVALFALPCFAQDKPVSGEVGTIPLVRFRMERNKREKKPIIPPDLFDYSDTVDVWLTVTHYQRPTMRYPGKAVKIPEGVAWYDECWNRMPGSWTVRKIVKR